MNTEQRIFLKKTTKDYCLGAASIKDTKRLLDLCKQFPTARAYLNSKKRIFDSMLVVDGNPPSAKSKLIIQKTIEDQLKLNTAELNGEEKMLNEFIGISRHSEIEKWANLLKDIQPPAEYDNIYLKPLSVSEGSELNLIWVKKMVPLETHEDIHESFLLLEGTADCYIDEEVFAMEKGDFMEIPLHLPHKIIITSDSPAKAILSMVPVSNK